MCEIQFKYLKEFTNNEHSEIISSALDDLNFAMKAYNTPRKLNNFL